MGFSLPGHRTLPRGHVEEWSGGTRVASPTGWTALPPSHTDRTLTISPHGRFELPNARATTSSTKPPAKKLTQETHQLLPPFRENQLWKPTPLAHAFQWTKDRAPLLWTSLNFIHRIYQEPQLCSNHAQLNRSSEGLPRNKLPNPLQKHIGGKKNKGWVGQA